MLASKHAVAREIFSQMINLQLFQCKGNGIRRFLRCVLGSFAAILGFCHQLDSPVTDRDALLGRGHRAVKLLRRVRRLLIAKDRRTQRVG